MTKLAKSSLQVTIDAQIEDEVWRKIEGLEACIRDVAQRTLEHCGLKQGAIEISVVLTHDLAMQRLNAQFRKKDKPTDILSFPQFDGLEAIHSYNKKQEILLGDLIFSYQTVTRDAYAMQIDFKDHMRHLTVHGMLHLLGFDHEEEEEAVTMENLEIEILSSLNIENPYTLKRETLDA